ncbi:hypothetical protein PHMEG_00030217, partial [Phytophthora megakarya]
RELCSIYDGKTNSATKAQKVYRLNGELHRTHLRANGDVRSHLYKMFEMMEQLKDLEAPVNNLQMVDILLRSLPNQMCYNELRRKVLFSKDMSKYTPENVRELILTAESRSKDWDSHAFGNNLVKKTQGSSSGTRRTSKQQTHGKEFIKKIDVADVECFNCGGKGHYKSDCSDLLAEVKREQPSGRKNAKPKYACSRKEHRESKQKPQVSAHSLKRDVVVSDVVKHATKDYDPNRWYFDTGTNAHIVANKEYFTSLQSMDDSDWNPTVSGFTDSGVAQAEGFGTVLLATMVDEQMVTVFLEDVLYVPRAGCNLFSPGQALDQGFKMSWDQDTKLFGMSKEGTEVIRTTYEHQLWMFVTHNVSGKKATKKHVIVNFTVTDGVADIDLWHARLGHTCPEYIRLMVDRGMAKGIMLKKRGKFDCADCHFGKQKRKTFQKNLERKITRVNDMVFADLLIPGVHNGTQYTAVLVVMDGYSHFVTTYLMKSRTRSKVNQLMKQYIAWAERQHGNVLEKFTMELWYKTKGIVHTKVGPKSSQLNAVERTHQTLEGMVKTMMHDSGLPKSMWIHALETVVFVKNRVFCKGAGRTPYEVMFGTQPDIHHIRAFGSLVYCYTPIAMRTKLSANCRIGFLLGYREDVVGCQVYFPTEHKKGFVADVKINESIKYKDRYGSAFESKVDKWLRTFDEYLEDGDLVASEKSDDDDMSVNEHDEEQSDHVSDEDMVEEDGASSVDWNNEDQQVWDDILLNNTGTEQSSELDNAEGQQLWNDVLRNSSLPDYSSDSAFEETQGGEAADADEDSNCEDDDIDSKIVEYDDEDVTNLPVIDDEVSEDECDVLVDPSAEIEVGNCLFDLGDDLEAGDSDSPGEIMIGRRRQREDEVKRVRDPKRANVDAKKQKREAPVRCPELREVHERHPPD